MSLKIKGAKIQKNEYKQLWNISCFPVNYLTDNIQPYDKVFINIYQVT